MSNVSNAQVSEAQLEAAIAAALTVAFPWVEQRDVRHQVGFSIRLGHGEVKTNGKTSWHKRGRADVVVFKGTVALAVLELKRDDLDITPEDEAQGLSYARLLTPIPPLVVVTNGKDTRLIATITGRPWTAQTRDEAAFEALVRNSARVAADDRRCAIQTLMGAGSQIWPQAVRIATRRVIDELTAVPARPTLPFSAGFQTPRDVVGEIAQAIDHNKRLVLLRGDPMIGKTNVAGQFAMSYPEDLGAVLLVERSAAGLYRALADLLAEALEWPATADEAREWLRRASTQDGPRLVVIFDDFDATNADARMIVEELTSTSFGERLQIVLCVDAGGAAAATTPDGRGDSIIGRRATLMDVTPLSNSEFATAARHMAKSGIYVMHGGQYAPELRLPWMLQAYASRLLEHDGGTIPSVLSTQIIDITRQRFGDPELRRRFRGLAKAAISDAQDQSRSVELMLELTYRFTLRRETVESHLGANDIEYLIQHGYLAPGISGDHVPLVSLRLPELLASELAALLATDLQRMLTDNPGDAAAWLAGAASNFVFGDVIAAQAVFDLERRTKRIPFNLVADLARRAPVRTPPSPGSRLAMLIDGLGVVDLKTVEGKTSDEAATGDEIEIGVDEGTFVDIHSWMVLAHLASRPSAVDFGEGEVRLDREILLTVGRSPLIMRPPRADFKFAFPSHELPSGEVIVCYKAGVVELPALLMLRFLGTESIDVGTDFVREAVEDDNAPLLSRVDIALHMISESDNENRAGWARNIRKDMVEPALLRHIGKH